MKYQQVHKSAHEPGSADVALGVAPTALRVIDVAVDAAEFPEHANPHLKLALILDAQRLDVSWQSDTGRAMHGTVTRGTTSVMPAQMPYTTRWRGAGRMLLLSFSPEFLGTAGASGRDIAGLLSPKWSQPDPFLVHLGTSILAAQSAELASQSYLDAAAEVAMVHLLHRYASVRDAAPPPLVPRHLARVIELIETHLDDDLSLAQLAHTAGMSTYGFARAFTKAVGVPPHRFVIQRRIARAKELLTHSALPIAEIAATLGFSSQSHLTTAFLREVGLTPARYRMQKR